MGHIKSFSTIWSEGNIVIGRVTRQAYTWNKYWAILLCHRWELLLRYRRCKREKQVCKYSIVVLNQTRLRHLIQINITQYGLLSASSKIDKEMSYNGNSPVNVKWYGKRGPWCYIIIRRLDLVVRSWNVGFHNMNEMESSKMIKYVYLSINWSSVPGKGWTTKCIEDIFQGLILSFNKDFK